MTIRPGVVWGTPFDGAEPDQVHDDPTLALRLVSDPTRPAWIRGGDLHRSLGAPDRCGDRMVHPVDLGFVRLDGGPEQPFVAHVVARRRGWRGRFLVVMNAAFIGPWHAGPRSHPNDGRLDIIDGRLGIRQSIAVRRRLATGSHLPHPALVTSSVRSGSFAFDRPMGILVDGIRVGSARTIEVRLLPDAGLIVA